MSFEYEPPAVSSGAGSPAVRAAARLPRPATAEASSQCDLSPRALVGYLIFLDVFFTGFAVFMGAKVSMEAAYGWLFLLSGLPAWLLVRMLFFSMRGSETGLVTVDRDGKVRMVTGKRSVRRLAGMYEDGAHRWIRGGALRGLAFFLGGMGLLVTLCLVFDSPAPLLLFLTGSLWAMLDLVRFTYVLLVKARRNGQQLLDSAELLPMLAAYCRHEGWRAATSGVPADRLLAVLAEHPDDARRMREYVAATRNLGAAALSTSRWSAGAS